MTPPIRAALLSLAALLAGVAAARRPAPAPPSSADRRQPVTILVSIDGFRPDYLDRGVTPNLSALAAGGVRAAMRPAFPTKTFPNHYTLVTGLRPDRNGIVGNTMLDPAQPGKKFTMATTDGAWWDEADPIWVDAERAGLRTGTLFWPGSAAAIHGMRPSDWWPFDKAVSPRQRTDAVLDWLRRPAGARPRFLTLYYDAVDTAGHQHGPDSTQVNEAAAQTDAEIGRLAAGLRALGQPANLVIVADHGMIATAPDRVVRLDTIVAPADIVLIEQGVYASFNAAPGRDAAVAAAVGVPHPHVRCWPKDAIPARLAYGRNPRVPAFLCLAEPGWLVTGKPVDPDESAGNHGYDNADPRMLALFVANGPAFVAGAVLPVFDNVDVYPLLRDLLGLPPAPGRDGTDASFRGVLRAGAPARP